MLLIPMRHSNHGQLLISTSLCPCTGHTYMAHILYRTNQLFTILFTHIVTHAYTSMCPNTYLVLAHSIWHVSMHITDGLFCSIHGSVTPPPPRLQHCISHEAMLPATLYSCKSSSAAGPKTPALSWRLTLSGQEMMTRQRSDVHYWVFFIHLPFVFINFLV